jgi:mono/diheme cytochrome c family protein
MGYIVPKFTQPPSLLSDKIRNWPDGRIFHVISRGQGLMPSYESQVPTRQRWAVIQYVRALQRAAAPTAADLKRYPDSEFTFEDDLPDTAKPQLWPER